MSIPSVQAMTTTEPMPPRQRIVATTAELIERQGYAATGLKQIVAESGAPIGSLYHYFPGGKEAIAVEAVEAVRAHVAACIAAAFAGAREPADAIGAYMEPLFDAGEIAAGRMGVLAGVAIEASTMPGPLRDVCAGTYERWCAAFRDGFVAAGIAPGDAERLAVAVVTGVEGAIVMARVRRDLTPLEHARRTLEGLVRAASP